MSNAGSCGTRAITRLADPLMLSLLPQAPQVTANLEAAAVPAASRTSYVAWVLSCLLLGVHSAYLQLPEPCFRSTCLQDLLSMCCNGHRPCSDVSCCSECLHLCHCQPTSVFVDSALHLHVCLTLKTACVLLHRLQLHVCLMLRTACLCVYQQVWPPATMGWTGKGCPLRPQPPPLPLPLRYNEVAVVASSEQPCTVQRRMVCSACKLS